MATAPAHAHPPLARALAAIGDKVVPACLALVLALQFHQVFARAINWDEFFFYAQVEQFAAGRLTAPLQTIHVQLFAWLTAMPGSGVDHIVAGRVAMFAAELVTLAAIYRVACHFTDRRTGLLAALAYVTAIFVFQHGYSFRVDPLATALTMAALVVLLTSRLRTVEIAAFAILLGLAGMVTIKSVLLAPAFVGVACLRWSEADRSHTVALRLVACAIAALAVFGALYGLHADALTAPEAPAEAAHAASKATVSRSANYVIAFGLPAFPAYLTAIALKSPLQAMVLLAAPVALVRADLPSGRKLALAGMLAAGLAFFFYRNTLPYFYAFILPPLVCGASSALRAVRERLPAPLVVAALMVAPVADWLATPTHLIGRQRALVEAAETIFPAPVAYFDFCGMLGRFDKANVFMTTWGITGYRAANIPVLRQRMEQTTVPLVLASEQENYLTFHELLTSKGPSPYFVDADADALRDNYLPFWGPYWLAGKAVPAGKSAHRSEFLVPGAYTVHDASVAIDGRTYAPGSVIHVGRGYHTLAAAGTKSARLFWGERLARPEAAPPPRPYWTDF